MSDLQLHCPLCGQPFRFTDGPDPYGPFAAVYFLCECPAHGLFHFGPRTDLTPGPPPDDLGRMMDAVRDEHARIGHRGDLDAEKVCVECGEPLGPGGGYRVEAAKTTEGRTTVRQLWLCATHLAAYDDRRH